MSAAKRRAPGHHPARPRTRTETHSAPEPSSSDRTERGRAGWAVRIALLALFGVVLVRTAWLCDDAYISLRTVDNFTNGFGLRWNVAERVQVFTHPLWVVLLSGVTGLTGELFRTTIWTSITLATGAATLLTFGLARSAWRGAVALLALVVSPAFVSYSTSGLEGPLSFLLYAFFAYLYLQPSDSMRRWILLNVVIALALTTRLDHVWIYVPALLVEIVRHGRGPERRSRLVVGAAGFLPLIAWLGFSLVYYGFLVPNPAAAKLATGLTFFDYATQGARYYFDALVRDPLTTLTMAAALLVVWRRGDRASRALAVGVLAYLVYVLCVGGDFMRGRFLALPFFASLGLATGVEWIPAPHRRAWMVGVPAAIVALGFATPRPTLLSGRTHGAETHPEYKEHFGIADERWIYFAQYGLFNERMTAEKPGADVQALRARQVADSTRLKIVWAAGRSGLVGGPRLHLVEAYALTDPLLARLPMPRVPQWRIGHFQRMLPAGYLRSLVSGRNEIVDPRIHEFYDRIRSVTRAPLFDAQRWRDIVQLNLRRSDHLVRGHRDYEAVSTPEFVALDTQLGNAAGPRIRWEAALGAIAQRDLGRAQASLRALVDLPQHSRYGYVAPDYALEVTRRALDHDKNGHTEFAVALLLFMADLLPERMELHAALGAVHLNAGQLDEARRHFEAAARLGDTQAVKVLEQLRNVSGD